VCACVLKFVLFRRWFAHPTQATKMTDKLPTLRKEIGDAEMMVCLTNCVALTRQLEDLRISLDTVVDIHRVKNGLPKPVAKPKAKSKVKAK
jgi:hypothetical protein